jgi:hypothetical protein
MPPPTLRVRSLVLLSRNRLFCNDGSVIPFGSSNAEHHTACRYLRDPYPRAGSCGACETGSIELGQHAGSRFDYIHTYVRRRLLQ